MKGLPEYIRSHFPDEAEHIIKVADQVCRQYFTFDNQWDLEQAPFPVSFEAEIDWESNPTDDPEFVWQFNRHRYFVCLGQAYQMTKDEAYAAKLAELMTDWIRRIPLSEEHKKKAWRSLEAGFRGENWTKAVSYIKDSQSYSNQAKSAYEASLYEHAAYLEQSHSEYKYISNWGVIENHGLFEIALALPDEEKKQHYIVRALEVLNQAAVVQFMGDGVHWEQSPLYHCEVVRCYLDVFLLARHNGIRIPQEMEKTVRKALYAMLAWKKPDSHMFLNGDSDDLDMAECFILGAYYFKDEVLKFAAGGRMDYEAAWILGMEGIRDYKELALRKPDFLSKALWDSGQFYLRSGWDEKADLLHFTCGTLGAGHGHSDKLHVDLVMDGRDILVDAGRYTYAVDHGRIAFKDPQAHNTSIVDGKLFTVCKDAWECTKLSQPVNTAYQCRGRYSYVQGGHLGYIEDGIFLNRRIVHIHPDIYVVADEMYGMGAHCYETYFHFNEAGNVTVLDKNTARYADDSGEISVFFCSTGFGGQKAHLEKEKTFISRHYNSKKENDCLFVRQQADGFASLYTIFSKESVKSCELVPVSSALKSIQYQAKQAEALCLVTAHTEYVLIICHEEVNSPTDLVSACGCTGFGNVIVFDRSQESFGGTVLHW